jgi:molybdopterin molybdotransferase
MTSVADAQRIVLEHCTPLSITRQPLVALRGLVLARDVLAAVDSPPFDKSMMDGYAVRSQDLTAPPTLLRVTGELTAGAVTGLAVEPGTAVRIMTGAPIPSGADAVVRFEETRLRGDVVEIATSQVARGTNILPRGCMFRSGATLLPSGRVLRAQEIALLAELGLAEAEVHPPPTAAVLATGDELVPPGQPVGPGQIGNSNESLLVAQLSAFGALPTGLGIARDCLEELRTKITIGLRSDILILTGGVSMGTRDLVPQVLLELGARQAFHKVELKPGKPVWFGIWDARAERGGRTLIFALPGNPVSSMVCCELFVRPAVSKLAGRTASTPTAVGARLVLEHRLREDRPTYFPAWLALTSRGAEVRPTGWKGSADLRSTIEANALIVFPPGDRTYSAGEVVSVWPLIDAGGTAMEGDSVGAARCGR